MLKEEAVKVQSTEYQNKIDDLAHEKTINENIYKAYEKNCEILSQQIAEIEKQILG